MVSYGGLGPEDRVSDLELRDAVDVETFSVLFPALLGDLRPAKDAFRVSVSLRMVTEAFPYFAICVGEDCNSSSTSFANVDDKLGQLSKAICSAGMISSYCQAIQEVLGECNGDADVASPRSVLLMATSVGTGACSSSSS